MPSFHFPRPTDLHLFSFLTQVAHCGTIGYAHGYANVVLSDTFEASFNYAKQEQLILPATRRSYNGSAEANLWVLGPKGKELLQDAHPSYRDDIPDYASLHALDIATQVAQLLCLAHDLSANGHTNLHFLGTPDSIPQFAHRVRTYAALPLPVALKECALVGRTAVGLTLQGPAETSPESMLESLRAKVRTLFELNPGKVSRSTLVVTYHVDFIALTHAEVITPDMIPLLRPGHRHYTTLVAQSSLNGYQTSDTVCDLNALPQGAC